MRRLSEAFVAVPDPRGCHGRRDDLPFLLTCLVASLLCNCNCNSTTAIGQWRRERCALLARSFPHQRRHTPTGATFRWLLARLPAADLEGALAAWGAATRPMRDREPVAFDGKTVRGATPQASTSRSGMREWGSSWRWGPTSQRSRSD